jgi:hypothetical protein
VLGEGDGLVPPLVLPVEVRRDPAELEELVALDRLGEVDLVKVVEPVDAILEALVVLVEKVELVKRGVDGGDVVALDLVMGTVNGAKG